MTFTPLPPFFWSQDKFQGNVARSESFLGWATWTMSTPSRRRSQTSQRKSVWTAVSTPGETYYILYPIHLILTRLYFLGQMPQTPGKNIASRMNNHQDLLNVRWEYSLIISKQVFCVFCNVDIAHHTNQIINTNSNKTIQLLLLN